MTKDQELYNPTSCFNKAHDSELIFVLLARDSAAPAAVEAWIDERIKLGINQPDDRKIVEARGWVAEVRKKREVTA